MLTKRGLDYMFKRRIFTVDPDYFPLDRMREIVAYLHNQTQKFGDYISCSRDLSQFLTSSIVLMTDPAVGYLPDAGYGPYDRGTQDDIWLKNENGSQHLGLVWPGMSRSRYLLRLSRDGVPYRCNCLSWSVKILFGLWNGTYHKPNLDWFNPRAQEYVKLSYLHLGTY